MGKIGDGGWWLATQVGHISSRFQMYGILLNAFGHIEECRDKEIVILLPSGCENFREVFRGLESFWEEFVEDV